MKQVLKEIESVGVSGKSVYGRGNPEEVVRSAVLGVNTVGLKLHEWTALKKYLHQTMKGVRT